MRFLRSAHLAAALVCTLSHASTAAADLTGHWYAEAAGIGEGSIFEIVETSGTVAIPLSIFDPSFESQNLQAARSGDSLAASGSSPRFWQFDARTIAGEDVIDGHLQMLVSGFNLVPFRLLARRCECFDGDTTDGDGCDAMCRIEPCFQCTGDPSTCTPIDNGADCNDHFDCTVGETCSSGACGGGTSVPSCVDLTGRWKVSTTGGSRAYLTEDIREVEQRDGFLRFRRPAYPDALAEVGTIDPLTGSLELSAGLLPGAVPYLYQSLNKAVVGCNAELAGTVTTDGQSFSGAGTSGVSEIVTVGTIGAQFYGGCSGSDVPFSQTGRRCAVGECLDAPEECPPCYARTGSGTCQPGPRTACLHSLKPGRSKVRISTADPIRRGFSWKWRSGAAVTQQMLGSYPDQAGLQVCMFDGNGDVLFQTYWFNHDDYYGYWLQQDWETEDQVTFTRRFRYPRNGKETVSVERGSEGDSEISFVAAHYGDLDYGGYGLGAGIDPSYLYSPPFEPMLPVSPLALPLRIQAQIDRGGACFESTFGEDGVRENADGTFKAKSTE